MDDIDRLEEKLAEAQKETARQRGKYITAQVRLNELMDAVEKVASTLGGSNNHSINNLVNIFTRIKMEETKMKVGIVVELPDGRRGTVVYNGLDGVGIKWGEHKVTDDDIEGVGGLGVIGVNEPVASDDYEYKAEAMLRESYPSAELECVGETYRVIYKEEKE